MSANATPTTGSSLSAETKKAFRLLGHQLRLLESEALTLDELSRSNERQNPFENAAKAYSKQIELFLQDFQDRWKFKCNDTEIGGLYVPRPRGYCRPLLILPPARIIAGPETICAKWLEEKKFNVWTFADGALNEKVPNDRRHRGMYALLHKGSRDADEELRSRSFEQNRDDGQLVKIAHTEDAMRGVEVLFFEDCNFRKTGEPLDPQTATITSSLDSDGFAVYVYWRDRVSVNRYDVQYAGPCWASRAAVYL
ncbi:MAG: hypothetical protein AAB767_03960 [Patescibacteria group bacterium]